MCDLQLHTDWVLFHSKHFQLQLNSWQYQEIIFSSYSTCFDYDLSLNKYMKLSDAFAEIRFILDPSSAKDIVILIWPSKFTP